MRLLSPRSMLSPVFVLLAVLSGPAGLAAEDPWTAQGLYVRHCAACHGEHGDGMSRARAGLDPPPRSFIAVGSRGELSRDRMIRSVTEGREGTAMVGWGSRLSGEQIAAVVDYFRNRFMQQSAAAGESAGESGYSAGGSGDAMAGRDIYRRNCAPCHGDRGSGATWTMTSLDPPPRDFTEEVLSRERMLKSVTEGREGTAMMPFRSRLDEEEIAAVVDYIRSEFMLSDAAPASVPSHFDAEVPAVDMSLAFRDGLDGDPVKGGEFYMNNCRGCHGEDGDGRGPRSSFIEPRPRDFLSVEARRTLNRPALFEAIAAGKRGTVMPAWKTVLTRQQIANVAEFVFQAYVDPDSSSDSLLESAKKKAD